MSLSVRNTLPFQLSGGWSSHNAVSKIVVGGLLHKTSTRRHQPCLSYQRDILEDSSSALESSTSGVNYTQVTQVTQFNLDTLKCTTSLLSTAFYTSTNAVSELTPLFSTLYGWRVMWNIIKTLVICGGNAGCMIATRSSRESQQEENAEAGTTWQSSASRAGTHEDLTVENSPPEVAGMGTVHMIELYGNMAEALHTKPGTPFALVANMAVQPGMRNRGIGRSLLGACETLVRRGFRPIPHALLLLVYRDNLSAIHLYQSCGYVECTSWMDPAWLEDAEKGKVGNSRRLLFIKEIL